jgi:hypothetical protein
MTLSYYLLIGGLINELFAQVNLLRPYSFDVINGRPVFPSHIANMTHIANELAFLIILVLFCATVWLYAEPRPAPRQPSPRLHRTNYRVLLEPVSKPGTGL